jgi:predicted lipoprotein
LKSSSSTLITSLAVLCGLGAFALGCTTQPNDSKSSAPALAPPLQHIADCIVELTENTHRAAVSLAADIQTMEVDSTASDIRNPEVWMKSQAAWKSLMSYWQQLEALQVGPLLPNSETGGLGIRERVYAWPLGERCQVEQQLVAEGYADAKSFSFASPAVKDLGALEVLLFNHDAANACSAASSINATNAWSDLGEDELEARRAAYAQVLAAVIGDAASSLAQAWSPNQGNFAAELYRGAASKGLYKDAGTAWNAVSDALLYLDKYTKDLKLAKPLGIADCAEGDCANQVESRHAKASFSHVTNNLRGAGIAILGCDKDKRPSGISAELISRKHTGLAEELGDRYSAALSAFVALADQEQSAGKDLASAISSDRQVVQVAYDKLKSLTDLLKADLVTALQVELPVAVSGDND